MITKSSLMKAVPSKGAAIRSRLVVLWRGASRAHLFALSDCRAVLVSVCLVKRVGFSWCATRGPVGSQHRPNQFSPSASHQCFKLFCVAVCGHPIHCACTSNSLLFRMCCSTQGFFIRDPMEALEIRADGLQA